MGRQTREQLRSEILERACSLFAAHGLTRTSLQSVADDVGYSKAGLLHHFPSKDAIVSAAILMTCEMTAAIVDDAVRLPAGLERDRRLVERLVDNTFEFPGTAAFLNSMATSRPATVPAELIQAGLAMRAAFGVDGDDGRLVQVLSACAGLHASAAAALRAGRAEQWRPLIVVTAMAALGHDTSAVTSDRSQGT